jgi:predicted AlkP superfamily pyrophosphatase or phosphodiesterase
VRAIATLLLVTGLALGQSSRPAAESRPGTSAEGRSRLVVMLVVDQLASEVLRTAWPHLGSDGFKRLAREGAFWPDALYDHACSETGPGHASLSTGASPAIHGIVGNEWIDSSTGVVVGCVDDPEVRVIGGHAGMRGASAHRLLAPTLGEAMRAARLDTRIVTVGIKDRAAILMAGSDGYAVWYDRKGGAFVSSYAFQTPGQSAQISFAQFEWISRLNELTGIEQYAGYLWEKSAAADAYADLGPDDDPVESVRDGSRKFPHDLRHKLFASHPAWVEAVCASPAGLELTFAAARFLIERAGLGTRDATDFLGVSLSTNDLVGHLYGPESHEVRDITICTDRMLADFLKHLDQIAGKGRYHVILTADHGIGPIPEALVRRGVPAGRVPADKLKIAIEGGLREAYGAAPESRHWVKQTLDADVLLDRALLAEKKIARNAAQDRAAEAALTHPGIAEAIPIHRVFDGTLSESPIHDAVRHAQAESRAVDVYVVPKPHWLFGGNRANHGTPHEYDRRVPLFLCGPGIRPGYESAAPVAPASGVVTIAAALGIAPPAKANHPVLQEAMLR